MKECLECHKKFSRRKGEAFKRWGERKYCSHDCANFSKERIKKATKCLWGRKPPKSAFKKGQIPHNKGKKYPELSGKNHHNWKGGISKNKHNNSIEYKQWRSNVFSRDNWTCQTCGVRGLSLEAHHIKSWADYPEFRLEISNGVTLCIECHKLTDNYGGRRKNKSTIDK